jgi:CheY-like chemotaxis protein
MRILVVDDNATNRRVCRALLAGEGCRIAEAANGVEALAAVRTEAPDLILMDVQMPVMDGLEALRRLLADPGTRAIPVVALTAYAMKGDREHLLQAGFADYLSKPVDIDRFLAVVRRFAAGARVGPGGPVDLAPSNPENREP